MIRYRQRRSLRLRLRLFLRPVCAAVCMMGAAAWGLPQGAAPSFGQTQVQQTGAGTMLIQQSTDKAGINWQSFSIGSGERVTIQQPGAQSLLLNRVISLDPSQILGQIQANGRVFLTNPNGIVFGLGSRLDVGSLVATTLNISDAAVQAGRYELTSNRLATPGAIDSRGEINAPGGSVALVAPVLSQSGTINAARVGLAAASSVTVDVEGDGLIFFNARNDADLPTRLNQLGTINADGGTAELRAVARAGFADTVLNLEGVVRARSVGTRDGRIVIAAEGGHADVSGQIDASGIDGGRHGGAVAVEAQSVSLAATARVTADGATGGGIVAIDATGAAPVNPAPGNGSGDAVLLGTISARGTGEAALGGQVRLTGNRVGLFGDALVDVSGAAGGGGVRIGGDFHGQGSLPRSTQTVVSAKAEIRADAIDRGDGGQVVVWSDGETVFDGAINARGGARAGEGGRVETSGKLGLAVHTSRVDTSASDGSMGQWLLDPVDIVVQTGGTAVYADVSTFAASTATEPATIAPSALNGRSSVDLQATNSITISSPIAMTSANAPLTLATNGAAGSIVVNASLSTNNGVISLSSGSGGITSNGSGSINAGNRTISLALAGSGNITLAAGLTTTNATASAISLSGAVDVQIDNIATGAAGTTSLDFSGAGTQNGGSSISSGSLTKLGSGTLTLSRSTNSYAGTTTVSDGTLALGANNVLPNASALVVNGATAILDIVNRTDTVASVKLQGGGSITGTGVLTSTAAFDMQSGTVSARLGGANGLNKTTAGTVSLSGNNTYTGATTVSAGTLSLAGANERLNDTSTLVVSGGTFDLGGFTETVAGVQQTGGTISNGKLTSTTTFDMQAGSASAILDGSAGLNKTTAGSFTLSGANTYTGATTVSAGTLSLAGANERLSDTSTLVVSGGTFDLGGFTETVAGVQQTGGTISNGKLISASAFDMQAGSASAILDGTVGLNKSTTGTVTLSGANTYTGLTSITEGTLVASHASALGTVAAGTVVSDGATLEINNVNIGTEAVNLAGTGVGAVGALVGTGAGAVVGGSVTLTADAAIGGTGNLLISNVISESSAGLSLNKIGSGQLTLSGNNSYTGTTTVSAGTLALATANERLANASTVVVSGGTFDLGGLTETVAGVQQTGGTISNGKLISTTTFDMQAGSASAILDGAVGLTKSTAGTVTLSGANTYTGLTSITDGTLVASHASALGTVAAGTVVSSGATLEVNNVNIGTEAVNLAGTGAGAVGALVGTGLGAVVGGSVTLTADATIGGTGNLSISNVVSEFPVASGFSLTKIGSGQLTLGGNNSYTGLTFVNNGTLVASHASALGSAATGTVVSAGATLEISNVDIGTEAVNLAGAGVGSVGALVGTGAGAVVGGSVTLTADTTIGGTGNLLISNVISESPAGMRLTKIGTGQLTLGGNNSYTGLTFINSGTLVASHAKALGTSAAGTVVASGATLEIDNVNIGSEAINLAGTGVGAVGALVGTGAGAVVGGSVTLTADATIGGTGNLLISNVISEFPVASGLSMTKIGSGQLTLGGSNSYTGTTTVSAGTLALGTANERLANASTLVVSGGTFDLGGFTETVAGVQQTGGTISNGKLTSSSAFDMQAGSASAILDGAVGLNKSTAGTVTLSGANTYTGFTFVNSGTLVAAHVKALGTVGSGTVVASGSTLEVDSVNIGTEAINLAGTGVAGVGALVGTGAGAVVGGSVTLTADAAIGGTGDLSISNAISQSSAGLSLTKIGSGQLTLGGNNSYTGTTTVSAGTLALGTANERLANSSTLVVSGGSFDLGGFTETVAGVQQTGGTIVNGTLNSSTAFNMQAGSASAILAGSAGLNKTTAGSYELSGANTYTGATTVSAGTLALAGANERLNNTSTLVVSGGSFDLGGFTETVAGVRQTGGTIVNGTLSSTTAFDMRSGSASAILDGSAGLNKTTGGSYTLSGANTYTGATTVSAGTLTLAGADERLNNASTLVISGGTFDLGGFTETVAGVQQTGGSIINGTLSSTTAFDMRSGSASAILDGSVGLNKTTGSSYTLSGANTYTGTTTVSNGTLVLGANDVFANGGAVIVNGAAAVLDINTRSDSVASVSLQGGGSIAGTTGVLTSAAAFDMQAGSVSAILDGSAGLNKTTAGLVTLTGANIYTGGTTIGGGTLRVSGSGAVAGNGFIAVNGNTLDIAGGASVANDVTILTGGSLISSTGGGTLASGTALTLPAASTISLAGGSGGLVVDRVITEAAPTGSVSVSSGTVTLSNTNLYSGATTIAPGATLQLGAGLGNGSIANSQVTDSGTLRITRNDSKTLVGDLIGSLAAGGTGAFDQNGGGTTLINSALDYSGGTTVSGGTLAIDALTVPAAKAGTGLITISSGRTLDLRNGVVVANDIASGGGTIVSSAGADSQINGVLTLIGNANTLSASGSNLTVTNPIGETGSGRDLTVTGGATVTMVAGGTYTGATTINPLATLQLGNGNAATLNSALTDNGTLSIDSTGTVTINGLAGAGSLLQAGSGTTVIDAFSGFSGGTTISNGTLAIDGASATAGTGPITIASGKLLDIRNGGTVNNDVVSNGGFVDNSVGGGTLAGTLSLAAPGTQLGSSGGSGLLVSGIVSAAAANPVSIVAGTVILSNANTYSGTTSIVPGATLQLGNGAALGSIANSTVTDNGTLRIRRSDSKRLIGDLTAGLSAGGSGGLDQQGGGTTVIDTALDYTGATTISAGTLAVSGAGTTGTAAGGVGIAAGATLDIISGASVADAVSNAGGSVTNSAGAGTLAGLMTLTTNGSKVGSSASGLNLSGGIDESGGVRGFTVLGGAGKVSLTGASSYTGTTTVNPSGVLEIVADGVTTFGTLGSGSVVDNGTLRINQSAPSLTTISALSGSGLLDQAGSGRTAIASATGFTGNATVTGGTLAVDGAAIAAAANVTISAGKTLDIVNGGTVAAAVTNAGGTVTNSAGAGTLSGVMTLTNDSSVDSSVTGPGTGLTISGAIGGGFGLTKDLGVGKVTLSAATGNGYTGTTTISGGTLAVSGNASTGTSAGGVNIAAGGTLDVINGATVADAINNAGGNVANSAGLGTVSGLMTLTANGSSASSGGSGLTFSGGIGEAGGSRDLTVTAGAGQVTMAGAGTYTGTTSINSGAVLQIGNGGAAGTVGSGGVINSGTLRINKNIAVAVSNLTGSGALDQAGSGTTTIGGALGVFTGNVIISGGTLAVDNASIAASGSNSVFIAAGKTLDILNGGTVAAPVTNAGGIVTNSAGNGTLSGAMTLTANSKVDSSVTGTGTGLTISGAIGGGFGLTKDVGPGTVTLSSASGNAYTGATTISAGTLAVSGAGTTGTAAGGVSIAAGATLDIISGASVADAVSNMGGTVDNSVGSGTLAGVMTLAADSMVGSSASAAGLTVNLPVGDGGNARSLTKVGGGTVTLLSANTYTGATHVSAGKLITTAAEQIDNLSAVTVDSGATLDLGGTETIASLAGGGNVLLGNNTLTTGDASNTTYGGQISGSGGLTKQGSGTMTLSGTNAYTGVTRINGGVLATTADERIADTSALIIGGSGNLSIGGNETAASIDGAGTVALANHVLTVGDGSNTTYGGIISGSGGSLVKNGGGILTLTGHNLYTADTTVNGGTLKFDGAAASAGASSGTIIVAAPTATLELDNGAILANPIRIAGATIRNSAGTAVLSGPVTLEGDTTFDTTGAGLTTTGSIAEIGGSRMLIKSGAAELALVGVNTYTGLTRIDSGSIRTTQAERIADASPVVIAAGAALVLGGNEAVASVAGAGAINLGASTLTVGGTNATTTFSGVISDGGSGGRVAKSGSGNWSLTGANSYGGGTAIDGGTLTLSGATASAGTGAITIAAGTTLDLIGGAVVNSAVSNQGGTLANSLGGATLSGAMTLAADSMIQVDGSGLTIGAPIGESGGSFGLTKLGAGNLTLSASTSSSYSGATIVSAGSLITGVANQIGDASAVTVMNGASLSLGGNETLGSLAGGGTVNLSTHKLTTGVNGATTTFAGVIGGSGAFAKSGVGTLTLSGANTYTGATTVNQGTLATAGGDNIADASAVTVASGATLSLDGNPAHQDTVASLDLAGTLNGAGTLSAATYVLHDGAVANANLGAGSLTSSAGESLLNGTSAATSVNVSAGRLSLGSANRLADTSALTVAAPGSLRLNGDDSVGSLNLAGILEGTGTLTAATYGLAGGKVNANLGSGALSSSGASTLSGTAAVTSVAVNSGDLSLTSANRLSDKANVTVATAASLSAASDQVIGRLAGDGQVKLSSNATLTTGAAGDSTFGGALVGAGALHKSGTSTFILTGDNTNTGITTIDAAGVLQVGSGGTTGNLGGNTIVDNGTLRFDHAGNYTVANAISGTGSLEQAGSGQFTATGVLSYTGISRVSAGAWLTGGANQLPDASDVVVGASGKLILAGDETVASITADGPVTLGGSVTTTADQIYRGSVTAPATAITLTAHDISAVNDGNLWGIQPLNLVANSAVVSAGKSDATTWRDLKLGHVTLTQGGVVDAGQIVLGDAVTLNGGVFELNAHQAASYAKLYLDPIDKAIRTVATLEQLALADDVVTQDAGSKIVVGNGATLLVSALGGGSVNLGNVANDLHGGVSVLSGPAFNTAWQTNRIDLVGGLKPAQLTSGQSQIQIAGSQILVAGKGIEGDLVAMKAEKLSTAVDATIVARLPYDDSRGTSVQHPALTFELLPAAFLASGTFGADGSEIKVAVGARETGSRTISFSAGFVQSLPLGGAKGATAIYLKGPAASSGSGGYRFFHDGAAVITEIPVSYNGVRPQSPQVTGSLSAVVAVSEGARKERFEESLRTENVALRLRLGVVAEVGPGPSATRGGGEAAPPEACASAANVFECSGGDNATRPQSQTPQSGSTQDNGSAGSRPATTAAGNGDKKAEACAQTADGKPCEDGK